MAQVPSNGTHARPARKQITIEELNEIRSKAERASGAGMTYNIWFNKMSGGESEDGGFNGKTSSQTRCNLASDVGYTRADIRARRAAGGGIMSDAAYCCLFFARGCCPHGAECTYLHRLPRANEINEQGVDVFGREKHGSYRDDMGGVGSMLRVNRTLYVGRINEDTSLSFRRTGNKETDDQDGANSTMGKIVHRHFSEWGEIEKVRAMVGRGIAFVTYKHEGNAQFAKEAMMHQSLDHNEVLNVRWSTDDPKNDPGPKEDGALRSEGEQQIAAIEAARLEQAQDYAASKDNPNIDWEEYARAKRQRLQLSDEEAQRLDEENRRGWETLRAKEAEKKRKEQAADTRPAAPPSLLSAEAIRSLASLRGQQKAQRQVLAGIAAYTSDSDEE